MSKTLISVLVLAAVIVGGYFIIHSNKGVPATPEVFTETQTGEQMTETNGKKMAFSEFIKNGGTYKCEVKQAMSDFENSGTVYIDGANVRGNFSTVAEGRPIDTFFIVKDGYTYTWSSAAPTMGFKMKVVADASADTSQTYDWKQGVGDYNCEAWTADASMFTPPASVTFKTQPQ